MPEVSPQQWDQYVANPVLQVRDVMRLKGATIWAAVRDIPSFSYMQELRESMGKASKRGQRTIPGYC